MVSLDIIKIISICGFIGLVGYATFKPLSKIPDQLNARLRHKRWQVKFADSHDKPEWYSVMMTDMSDKRPLNETQRNIGSYCPHDDSFDLNGGYLDGKRLLVFCKACKLFKKTKNIDKIYWI